MKLKNVVVSTTLMLLLTTFTVADPYPNDQDVAFANEVKDTLVARLFALLLDEFENTNEDNYLAGSEAISLVFDDNIATYRLVGDIQPLQESDLPQDDWETWALQEALAGRGVSAEVQKVKGKYYVRESIPLQNFSPSCNICHLDAYPPTPEGGTPAYVGALMVLVPIAPSSGPSH